MGGITEEGEEGALLVRSPWNAMVERSTPTRHYQGKHAREYTGDGGYGFPLLQEARLYRARDSSPDSFRLAIRDRLRLTADERSVRKYAVTVGRTQRTPY